MSPVTAAGLVTETNFVVCSYGKKVSDLMTFAESQ